MTRSAELRNRFLQLHLDPPDEPTPGILVMPNPWDIGSAKVLSALGARALATTSAGFAGSIGKADQHIDRDELLAHVVAMTTAVDLPFNVDAEDCYATSVEGVAETVGLIAQTDAAGFSIEDYDTTTGAIRPVQAAAERVAAAKAAADDLVVTARAENHLYGVDELEDTIRRLIAYRDAGADVVYAPGVTALDDIAQLVERVRCPVNVLALPGTPPIPALARVGVARVSIGSLLAWAAYGALAAATGEIFSSGTTDYTDRVIAAELRAAAFAESNPGRASARDDDPM